MKRFCVWLIALLALGCDGSGLAPTAPATVPAEPAALAPDPEGAYSAPVQAAMSTRDYGVNIGGPKCKVIVRGEYATPQRWDRYFGPAVRGTITVESIGHGTHSLDADANPAMRYGVRVWRADGVNIKGVTTFLAPGDVLHFDRATYGGGGWGPVIRFAGGNCSGMKVDFRPMLHPWDQGYD